MSTCNYMRLLKSLFSSITVAGLCTYKEASIRKYCYIEVVIVRYVFWWNNEIKNSSYYVMYKMSLEHKSVQYDIFKKLPQLRLKEVIIIWRLPTFLNPCACTHIIHQYTSGIKTKLVWIWDDDNFNLIWLKNDNLSMRKLA